MGRRSPKHSIATKLNAWIMLSLAILLLMIAFAKYAETSEFERNLEQTQGKILSINKRDITFQFFADERLVIATNRLNSYSRRIGDAELVVYDKRDPFGSALLGSPSRIWQGFYLSAVCGSLLHGGSLVERMDQEEGFSCTIRRLTLAFTDAGTPWLKASQVRTETSQGCALRHIKR